MKLVIVIGLVLLFSLAAFAQNASESSLKSDLRLHELKSRVFNNTRKIRVLLSPGYDEKTNREKKYPVLYLNDGQTLFDAATSTFNAMEWRADETLAELLERGEIEPLIIVGIDNAGKRERPNEYLPFADEFLSPPVPDPQGAKYPEFLLGEVVPLIEKHYRVKKEAKDRALGGASYGALIALYTALEKPESFGALLLESPSFYVAQARILENARKAKKLPQKIYVGVGTNESGSKDCQPGAINDEAVGDVVKLKKILQNKGFKNDRLKVVIDQCAVHNEDAWAKRLPEALKFLFPVNSSASFRRTRFFSSSLKKH